MKTSYERRVKAGMDVVRRSFDCSPDLVVAFGDLHLEHIREWRDEHLPQVRVRVNQYIFKWFIRWDITLYLSKRQFQG